MKAIRLHIRGGPEALVYEEARSPTRKPERYWCASMLPRSPPPSFCGCPPGRPVQGRIALIGANWGLARRQVGRGTVSHRFPRSEAEY